MQIGDEVVIYCNTTGNCDPAPVINWYKMEHQNIIIQEDTSSQLMIHASTVEQSGSYFCCVKIDDETCTPSVKGDIAVKG